MAIERKRVTKRSEQHPAELIADGATQESHSGTPPSVDTADAPAPRTPKRRAASIPAAVPADGRGEGEDGPKIPTSYRLPRSLLDRLDRAARVIPAELDRNMSKNQIVEMAIDEFLKRFNV